MVTINGKTYYGNNITVKNNVVFIDGKQVEGQDEKIINITVEGNIDSISADSCEKIVVHGNSGKIKTMSGDVEIGGDVNGDVGTMSGDVKCGNISGSVKTMSGDIRHK